MMVMVTSRLTMRLLRDHCRSKDVKALLPTRFGACEVPDDIEQDKDKAS